MQKKKKDFLRTNNKAKVESLIIANNDKSCIQQSVDELIINEQKEVSYRNDSCCETILLYDLNTECLETSSTETINLVEEECSINEELYNNEISVGEEVKSGEILYSALNKEEESIQFNNNNCLIN